jgi:PhoPQ-activated pathogenicity-related protein
MNKKLINIKKNCIKLYYYNELVCPNCLRQVPNKEHFIKNGCKWCLKKDEQT